MSIYNSGNNDSNKAINLYNDLKDNTQDLVIVEGIEKTVGVGKDFETLDEALRWAETLLFSSLGTLIILLDDGTHVLGGEDTSFNEDNWSYYNFFSTNITVESASGNRETCFITIDSYDDGDNWPGIIDSRTGSFTMKNITFDLALDGYPYPQNVTPLAGDGLRVYYSNFKNCYGIILSGNGNGSFIGSSFSGIEDGLSSGSGGWLWIRQCTIENSARGVYANYGGRISLDATTLTNNTVDTNIPLNEVQYDGSYITNKASALSFKA